MGRLDRFVLLDLGLALVVTALLEIDILAGDLGPKPLTVPIAAVIGAALIWRRAHALAAAAVVSGALVVEAAAGFPLHDAASPLLAGIVVAWSVGQFEPIRRALLGLAVVVVGAWAAMALAQAHGGPYVAMDYPWVALFLGVPWAVACLFGARTRSLRVAEGRAEQLERDRLAAVAEERARIARELHDVIAHSVSVMVVQAGAAEAVLKRDPARAAEPMRAVQETGRQALVEMSRLVGLLREGGEELGLAPQPRLDALDALLAQVRESGLPVELRVEGERRPLPLGIELSAYRIVQEALTNALKHAGEAHAEVRLRYDDDAVEVEVVDDGRGDGNGHVGGHGLAGIRERVAVFGGEFGAGPRPGGGFAVRARLPAGAGS